MASSITTGPGILQDDILDVKPKKGAAGLGGQFRSHKTSPKRGGFRLGARRALKNITNRRSSLSSLRDEVRTKKKDISKAESRAAEQADFDDFDVFEEGFRHDHSKCVDEQRAASYSSAKAIYMDLVLPSPVKLSPEPAQIDSFCCSPEPAYMSEIEDFWTNSPESPKSLSECESPPESPAWSSDEYVDFVLAPSEISSDEYYGQDEDELSGSVFDGCAEAAVVGVEHEPKGLKLEDNEEDC